jgi:hypothetical protein
LSKSFSMAEASGELFGWNSRKRRYSPAHVPKDAFKFLNS